MYHLFSSMKVVLKNVITIPKYLLWKIQYNTFEDHLYTITSSNKNWKIDHIYIVFGVEWIFEIDKVTQTTYHEQNLKMFPVNEFKSIEGWTIAISLDFLIKVCGLPNIEIIFSSVIFLSY